MSSDVIYPTGLLKYVGSAALGLLVLATGAFFGIQASNNSSSLLANYTTQDGRSIHTITSSGATTESGVMTVSLPQIYANAPIVSPPYANTDVARFTGSAATFFDVNVMNKSPQNATSDYVAQNIGATNTANFIDLGYTSPIYNVPSANALIGPSEGYLYTPNYGLDIGTVDMTGAVKFFVTKTNVATATPSILTSEERMRITQSGAEIGTHTGLSRLILSGALLIGKGFGLKVAPIFPVGLVVQGSMSGGTLTLNKQGAGSGKLSINGSAGSFVCMDSPSGAKWVITVSNAGVITTTGGNGMCP